MRRVLISLGLLVAICATAQGQMVNGPCRPGTGSGACVGAVSPTISGVPMVAGQLTISGSITTPSANVTVLDNDGAGGARLLALGPNNTTYGNIQTYSGRSDGNYFKTSQIDRTGVTWSGTIPTVTGTGTPTIAAGSTDTSGEVTSGISATSVVITFSAAKTNAPFCTVSAQSEPITYTISPTAVTITQAALTGDKIDYVCSQH